MKELAKLLNNDDIRNVDWDKSSIDYVDWYKYDISCWSTECNGGFPVINNI